MTKVEKIELIIKALSVLTEPVDAGTRAKLRIELSILLTT